MRTSLTRRRPQGFHQTVWKTAMARHVIASLCGAALLSLSACANFDDELYFPLKTGAKWTYHVHYDTTEAQADDSFTLSVDREVSLRGQPTVVRRSSDGMEYYLQRNSQGLVRVATRTDTEEQATMDAKPRVVMPAHVALGSQWSAPSVPYLLKRKMEFPRELKYAHAIDMQYKVESNQQSVDTPGGHYDGCLLVVGLAALHIFVDPVNGYVDLPITTREWYCAKVGLVKFEREEQVNSPLLSGGKVSYTLTSWEN